MNKVSTISRILLGMLFLVFGLNGFINFIPQSPIPAGPASQFIGALAASHYFACVFLIELVCGVLLLVDQYVLLALTVLGPVSVNITFFHLFMAPQELPIAIVVVLLWFLSAYRYRTTFYDLLQRRVR